MQDAQLVLYIACKDDWYLFRTQKKTSELLNWNFLETCNTNKSMQWIRHWLETEGYAFPFSNHDTEEKKDSWLSKKYGGGLVLKPKVGMHWNVLTGDFKAMYPTIIITRNLSSETVNCEHEECRVNGKIPDRIMELVGAAATKKGQTREMHYWICH
jgi:DNA polymerase elongation subunit (family B)